MGEGAAEDQYDDRKKKCGGNERQGTVKAGENGGLGDTEENMNGIGYGKLYEDDDGIDLGMIDTEAVETRQRLRHKEKRCGEECKTMEDNMKRTETETKEDENGGGGDAE